MLLRIYKPQVGINPRSCPSPPAPETVLLKGGDPPPGVPRRCQQSVSGEESGRGRRRERKRGREGEIKRWGKRNRTYNHFPFPQ
uniref:Uncharacterized protein n=1 Tax=Archaeoglobus fulgidus TaxID=2234 RepID=A0A7C2N9F3_ARCFL